MGHEERKTEDLDVVTALMQRDIDDLKTSMAALQQDLRENSQQVADLVQAWQTAGNVVTFVKWLAGIAAAVAVLTGSVKGWFGH